MYLLPRTCTTIKNNNLLPVHRWISSLASMQSVHILKFFHSNLSVRVGFIESCDMVFIAVQMFRSILNRLHLAVSGKYTVCFRLWDDSPSSVFRQLQSFLVWKSCHSPFFMCLCNFMLCEHSFSVAVVGNVLTERVRSSIAQVLVLIGKIDLNLSN